MFLDDNIAINPLYFVRSEGLYLDNGSIGRPHFGSLGIDGRFRPSSASAADYVYFLSFGATNVYPSNGPTNRWGSLPLRCLESRPSSCLKFYKILSVIYYLYLCYD